MSERGDALGDFQPWRQWLEANRPPVFPTHSSFEWFMRQHGEELVASGDLIRRNGKAGNLINTRTLGPRVLEILRRASKAA